MICATYGQNAVSHTTFKRWYQKFRQGDFSLEDEPWWTITTDHYQQQLTNLNDALEEKRPFAGQRRRKVILLYDNAWPLASDNLAKTIQDHIFALVWELLLQRIDMAPTDYYLFQSLQHHLAHTHFVRFEEIRKCIDDFIVSELVSFYRQGIRRRMAKDRWCKRGIFRWLIFFVCFWIKIEFYKRKYRTLLYT